MLPASHSLRELTDHQYHVLNIYAGLGQGSSERTARHLVD